MQTDMAVWVLNILFLLLVAFVVRRYQVPPRLSLWYWPALATSILCGILVGVYYTHAGGGDTFFYYRQGSILADHVHDHPREIFHILLGDMPGPEGFVVGDQPRSLFFVVLVAFLQYVTGSGYWLLAAYFSVLRFLASWYLFTSISSRYTGATIPAAVAFLFFPSVVFWGSGLLKESLSTAALFVLVGLYVQKPTASWITAGFRILVFLLAAYVLLRLRYFYAAGFVPVFVAALLAHWSVVRLRGHDSHRHRLWYPIFFLLLFCLVYVGSGLHYNLRWQNLPAVLYGNYVQFVAESEPGRFIQYEHLGPDVASILYYMPKACFSTLFRPNVWDYAHPLQIPLIIENLMMLSITVLLLFKRRTWHLLQRKEVIAALVFIVFTAAMLGIASPNYGSLARYRIGVLALTVLLLGLGVRYVYFHRPDR